MKISYWMNLSDNCPLTVSKDDVNKGVCIYDQGSYIMSVAHRIQVQSLYKRSLKLSLDWYIQRDLWRQKALEIRARFDQNKMVTNPKEIQALVKKTEKELEEWAHPDPYKLPMGPEGTKWERNLPPIVNDASHHH